MLQHDLLCLPPKGTNRAPLSGQPSATRLRHDGLGIGEAEKQQQMQIDHHQQAI